jgi:hypothetical protein
MPELIQKRGKKGATFFVRYAVNEGLKSTTIQDAEKRGAADILLAGKMTVLPPSRHPETGKPYTWSGQALLEADLSDLPVHALRHQADTTPPRIIRMADAAHWLQAAEGATGLRPGKFVETVAQAQIERVSERIDNEPIVVALKELLAAGPFEGTMGELLDRLSFKPRSRYFPETATKLSKDLDRLKTGMVKVGLFFERRGRSNKGQQVRVWLTGQENQSAAPKPRPGQWNY